MTRRLRFLLILLALAFVIVGLHRIARPLWSPALTSLRGGNSVSSVIARTKAQGLGLKDTEKARVRQLAIIALKEDRLVEVWGIDETGKRERLRTYPFFGSSGELGPKLREGDGQIPEGVYRIEYLNPNSSYHLSLKIDYPNQFDREKGKINGRDRLGFDIFFHGNSVTVGCIPIGDEAIEDLFTLAAEVGIKQVAVIITPWDFRVRRDEPAIDEIEWESELYQSIREAMNPFRRRDHTGDTEPDSARVGKKVIAPLSPAPRD